MKYWVLNYENRKLHPRKICRVIKIQWSLVVSIEEVKSLYEGLTEAAVSRSQRPERVSEYKHKIKLADHCSIRACYSPYFSKTRVYCSPNCSGDTGYDSGRFISFNNYCLVQTGYQFAGISLNDCFMLEVSIHSPEKIAKMMVEVSNLSDSDGLVTRFQFRLYQYLRP